MSIRVGTSGWNYPTGNGTWNGVFYPARRPRGFDELRYYAEHFDIVEVNSTFYRMPDPGLVGKWIGRTPADFQFAIKLFQKFTHPDMYLARAGVKDWSLSLGDVDAFRAGVAPLVDAGRMAAMLVQFPRASTPTSRCAITCRGCSKRSPATPSPWNCAIALVRTRRRNLARLASGRAGLVMADSPDRAERVFGTGLDAASPSRPSPNRDFCGKHTRPPLCPDARTERRRVVEP
ncbi:MAG: DUF72 domain-containing protein [Acidobacteria bacterium]|nr:DUF72 domain-containing protein [Acidobacteriota bacterium]